MRNFYYFEFASYSFRTQHYLFRQHSSELPEHHEAGLAIGGSAGVVEGAVPAAGDAARHGRLPRQGEMKLQTVYRVQYPFVQEISGP